MQITELLQRLHNGDQNAMEDVIPLIYGELEKIGAGAIAARNKKYCVRDDSAGP